MRHAVCNLHIILHICRILWASTVCIRPFRVCRRVEILYLFSLGRRGHPRSLRHPGALRNNDHQETAPRNAIHSSHCSSVVDRRWEGMGGRPGRAFARDTWSSSISNTTASSRGCLMQVQSANSVCPYILYMYTPHIQKMLMCICNSAFNGQGLEHSSGTLFIVPSQQKVPQYGSSAPAVRFLSITLLPHLAQVL